MTDTAELQGSDETFGPCIFCGREQTRNPHPHAGLPGHPEAGYTWLCVPCLVENRHRWASRAMRAEARSRPDRPANRSPEPSLAGSASPPLARRQRMPAMTHDSTSTTAALRGHGGPRVGTELIHAERAHQINDRGFDGQHDIDNNSHAILAVAALHFIETAIGRRDPRSPFPLMDESLSCKPRGVGDPIHDLVKAGALIAAEIDRLRAIGIETAGNEGVWT